ncbi:MAG: 3-deoxy-D-manno-octulosonic acid transferase [Ignavibacteria bacterium]|nr:3-deoxy-D-manno-octulosonic acid transferase [Ignavibacteria bacterium]
MFWKIFYQMLVVPGEWILFHVLAMFNSKAARGIRGRKNLFAELERKIAALNPVRRRIWFHASSMGEFEQAKPIIAELKQRQADVDVIVSFFSASGYEHSQNYKPANIITYIPFDSSRNARRFVEIVRPAAVVIVRYDVWPNHLWALQRAGVPTFIASATLRNDVSRKFPIVRQFHKAMYNVLDFILTVSPDDKSVFDSLCLAHPTVVVIGDTRYDQVLRRSTESIKRRILDERVLAGKKVLVVGSSWKEDEEVIIPAWEEVFRTHPELLIVLVPHEPTVENLERIESEVENRLSSIRFSQLNQYSGEQIVIVDSVGILLSLYQYAHTAYVGGSFRTGIHNVLEPAVYGIPVLFGPVHHNSQEAVELVREGGAVVCRDSHELCESMRIFLDDETQRIQTGKKASAFVQSHVGATTRFLSFLEKVL